MPRGPYEQAEFNRRVAHMIRHRLRACAWLLQRGITHVDASCAGRILRVTGTRVRELINLKKLEVIEGMPGGKKSDRWISVHSLMDAPSALEAGRRQNWHIEREPSPYKATDRDSDARFVENRASAKEFGRG